MTFRDAEKMVKADGWYYVYANGSHYYYNHATKHGKVCIPFHAGKDLSRRVVDSIKRQAGIE